MINTQLVTVTVDLDGPNPRELQCLLTLGDYSQERAKTEYNCMSSDNSTVGLGSITRAPLEFETLYNEDDDDGQTFLKAAFETNSNIRVSIEFDNAPSLGAKGTTLTGLFGLSVYVMAFPKDGKIGANFTLEFMGTPVLTEAGQEGAKANGSVDFTGTSTLDDGTIEIVVDSLAFSLALGTLPVGTPAATVTEEIAELINTDGTYEARILSSKAILGIFSKNFGIIDNGTTVTNTSTDTGVQAVTTDFAGGVDPV